MQLSQIQIEQTPKTDNSKVENINLTHGSEQRIDMINDIEHQIEESNQIFVANGHIRRDTLLK